MPPAEDPLATLLGGPEFAWLRARLRARLAGGKPLSGVLRHPSASPAERDAAAQLLGRRAKGALVVRLSELEQLLAAAGLAASLREAVEALEGPVANATAVRQAEAGAWSQIFAPSDPREAGWLEALRLNGLLRRLGGMAIDRGAAKGVVEQMIDQFHRRDSLWLGIAPEGTRKPVTRWKSGFWHIAHDAGVPVFPVAFHYPEKIIRLGPLFDTTDDMAADVARLRAYYAPFQGKYHGI